MANAAEAMDRIRTEDEAGVDTDPTHMIGIAVKEEAGTTGSKIETEMEGEGDPMGSTIKIGTPGEVDTTGTRAETVIGETGITDSSCADSNWGMHAQLGAEQKT